MTMKLYEISERLRTLLESMDDYFNEETGELDQGFLAELNDLDDEAKHKIEGIGVVCRELQGEADLLKSEYNRLKARKESAERRRRWLMGYVSDMMRDMRLEKHKSPNGLFTVYMQKNPDKVEVDYPDNLPAKYQRIPPVEAMISDLKADMGNGLVSGGVLEKAGIRTIIGQRTVRYK